MFLTSLILGENGERRIRRERLVTIVTTVIFFLIISGLLYIVRTKKNDIDNKQIISTLQQEIKDTRTVAEANKAALAEVLAEMKRIEKKISEKK